MSKPAHIMVPQTFLDDTARFGELASFAIKRAVDEINIHRTLQEKAAVLRPAVLAHMTEQKLIAPGQQKQAEVMLASHDMTLQLLKVAIDKIAELSLQVAKTPQSLGKGEHEKQGGDGAPPHDSLKDPFVGRRTSERKASDDALFNNM